MAAGLPSPGSHFPVLAPGSVRRNMPYFRRERAGPRIGHWFRHFRVCKARHHLVRHGDRINRRRNFDCGFSHVLFIEDRKSTRLNSSHLVISYAVSCLKKDTHLSPLPARFTPALDLEYAIAADCYQHYLIARPDGLIMPAQRKLIAAAVEHAAGAPWTY